MRAPRSVRRALMQLYDFSPTSLKHLEDSMLCTLSWENALEEQSAWSLWNPILNAALESIDKPDRNQ